MLMILMIIIIMMAALASGPPRAPPDPERAPPRRLGSSLPPAPLRTLPPFLPLAASLSVFLRRK